MRTPTRCRSRFATAGWMCSPTRARTAITASQRGVPTSGRRSHTTPWNWTGAVSRAKAARSCGFVTQMPGKSTSPTSATPSSGPPSTTAICHWTSPHGTGGASGLTVRRAASTSSTRSWAAASIVRLAFHLGPEVAVELDREYAILRWPGASTPGSARLELPQPLRWSLHRGETEPILGWYSCGLGRRAPAVTLIGRGRSDPARPLTTRLEFFDVGRTPRSEQVESAVSWFRSDAMAVDMPDVRAEAG